MLAEFGVRALAWTDYRLALLFAVVVPLGLLVWSLRQRAEAMRRLMAIYWRVSSLLAIAVYLTIAQWSLGIGLLAGWFARLLIPITLWFWADLNEEIEDWPATPLKLTLTAWRWAMTLYCALGVAVTAPLWRCALANQPLSDPLCQAWAEAPWQYRAIFHANTSPGFLGFLGMVGLVVYLLSLIYFLTVRLGRKGRSAME